MKKLLIRFNTLHGGSSLKWRVVIDSKEYLASEVVSSAPWVTTMDEVSTERGTESKHHITVEYTDLVWRGTKLIIYYSKHL